MRVSEKIASRDKICKWKTSLALGPITAMRASWNFDMCIMSIRYSLFILGPVISASSTKTAATKVSIPVACDMDNRNDGLKTD